MDVAMTPFNYPGLPLQTPRLIIRYNLQGRSIRFYRRDMPMQDHIG
ncbi:MAG TPA: hypothetical protein VF669_21210 [Tepidisphaeraceae bacterium]|jgi:hypothetical protein